MKSGGADLHLLPAKGTDNERAVLASVRQLIADLHGDVAGWAFVAWESDMGSVARSRSYSDAIPRIMIPTFVKERLRAEIIEHWTMLNFEPPA